MCAYAVFINTEFGNNLLVWVLCTVFKLYLNFKAKMPDTETYADLIVNNKNKIDVRCQFCKSLMLKAENAEFCKHEFKLPLMQQKCVAKDSAADTYETEAVQHFWLIKDMITFENIGFTNAVDQCKYLICADCERGPVGYYDLSNRYCYVALGRVKHDKD